MKALRCLCATLLFNIAIQDPARAQFIPMDRKESYFLDLAAEQG
jgi:hypothetical protein